MADATARPMRVPVTFIPYLEKHRIYNLFQELLSRVIIKRPDDHLQFIKDELLEIVKFGSLKCYQELKITEEPEGSISSLVDSNESLTNQMKKVRLSMKAESVLLADESQEEVFEKIISSIDYQLNETLASMTEEEFRLFSEEVISNWRTIHRSKKFYDIRELPFYQRVQEEMRRHPESDTDSDAANNENSSIYLFFHPKESVDEQAEEDSKSHVEGSNGGSDLKLSQSIRSLDIKIRTDKTSSSESSANNESIDQIATVSYTENDTNSSTDERKSDQQIVQVKLLEGVPSNITNEIKEYIMNLIQEMVEKIILELPKQSLPRINLNIFQRPTEKKKTLQFPRGPVMIPRVILIGPPGAGKHRQARLLAEKLNVINVTMGLLLLAWEKNKGNHDLASLVRKSTLTGDEKVNDITISILKERLLKEDCLKKGWVLTGYPATASQAAELDKIETPPNRIIYLNAPLDQCRETLDRRMFDVDTGEIGYIQKEPIKEIRHGTRSSKDELLTGLDNIEYIFGVHSAEVDAVAGYIMNILDSNDKGGHGLFDNISQCPGLRKRFLRSPADDPKYLDLRFRCHEDFKSQLLKYYGGWCTILNIGSLPPVRIHEAIMSVITGPFPSFENAEICDRTSDISQSVFYRFRSEIETKIQLEMLKFFGSIYI
ncbi:uncharacterized protein LOC124167162 [Ischnura elegans]|uniref:uncharacterized protein LOC124167162 n=1 Tax=Ischnura elegans TaxID=197161 RepID=UPI001ED869A3|nr:uncharacterized protein LOC124167162 [Ischnura elegans]